MVGIFADTGIAKMLPRRHSFCGQLPLRLLSHSSLTEGEAAPAAAAHQYVHVQGALASALALALACVSIPMQSVHRMAQRHAQHLSSCECKVSAVRSGGWASFSSLTPSLSRSLSLYM